MPQPLARPAPRRGTTRPVQLTPDGVITAIVAVTGNEDEVGDVIVPGAFARTLRVLRPKVVFHHSWDKMVGRVLHIEELAPGDRRLPKRQPNGEPWPPECGALVATMQFNMDVQLARDTYSMARFYAESGEAAWSIGYKVPPGLAGKKGNVRHIYALALYEVSLVLHGAHPMTMALEVKSAAEAVARARVGMSFQEAPSWAGGAAVGPLGAGASAEAKSAAAVVGEAKAMDSGGGGSNHPRSRTRSKPGPVAPPVSKDRPRAKGNSPVSSSFDESKHKRAPKGQANGGQFISKGSGYSKAGKADERGTVKTAQSALIKQGFLGKTDGWKGHGDDGYFGVKTEAAVKAWQKANGHEADGKLTDEQREKLESGKGKPAGGSGGVDVDAINAKREKRGDPPIDQAGMDAAADAHGGYDRGPFEDGSALFEDGYSWDADTQKLGKPGTPQDQAAVRRRAPARVEGKSAAAAVLEAKGNRGPTGTPGGRQNWVDQVGGLPGYMREVVHALRRSGTPDARAYPLAVASIKRWARGGGGVKPSTRAKAVAALSEWTAKRARAHADNAKAAVGAGGAVGVAGLAVVAEDTGRVLMLQRGMDDDDPAAGTWEFPGGHLEDGEDALVGALREWHEETGATVPATARLTGSWDSPDGKYRGFVLAVPVEAGVTINAPHGERQTLNPDDPDGDHMDVAAWFAPVTLPAMPSLRAEVRDTPWSVLTATGDRPATAGPTRTETKSMPQMTGSLEAIQEAVRHGAQDLLAQDGGDCYVAVEATFTDHAIVTVHRDGEPESYAVPYTVTADGDVELGAPAPVELEVVAVAGGAAASDEDEVATRVLSPAAEQMERLAALVASTRVEGKQLDDVVRGPLAKLLDALSVKGMDVASAVLDVEDDDGEEDLAGKGGMHAMTGGAVTRPAFGGGQRVDDEDGESDLVEVDPEEMKAMLEDLDMTDPAADEDDLTRAA